MHGIPNIKPGDRDGAGLLPISRRSFPVHASLNWAVATEKHLRLQWHGHGYSRRWIFPGRRYCCVPAASKPPPSVLSLLMLRVSRSAGTRLMQCSCFTLPVMHLQWTGKRSSMKRYGSSAREGLFFSANFQDWICGPVPGMRQSPIHSGGVTVPPLITLTRTRPGHSFPR